METGKELWKAKNWTAEDMFHNEIKGTVGTARLLRPFFFLVLIALLYTRHFYISYRGNTQGSVKMQGNFT